MFKAISLGGRLGQFAITRRRVGVIGLTLAACGLMAASAYVFRPATAGGLLVEAALLMLAGGAALWGATAWQNRARRETRPSPRIETPSPAEPAAHSGVGQTHQTAISRHVNLYPPAPLSPRAEKGGVRVILSPLSEFGEGVGGRGQRAKAYLLRRSIFMRKPCHSGARAALPQIALALGLVALLALVEINGGFIGIAALQQTSLRAQFGLLVAAIALITWGLGAETGARVKTPVSRRAALALGLEVGVVAAVTLLALFLRVWHLGDAVHKFVDEIHFSTAVAGLLPGTSGIHLLAPFAGITAFPWLYPFWQSEVVFIGGRTLESLRLVSAVLGTLTIPALYLLARTLFDRTTALMAALLLATFPPHLHFSRIGLNNVADPLFGTLALAFLARGLKTGRRMDYALAGAALALTQYFYEGGRLLFPPLAAAWVLLLAIVPRLTRRRGAVSAGWRLNRRGLATMALAALLVGLPIYTTLLANGLPLMPRMGTVAVGGTYWQRVMTEGTPQTLEQHILRPLLVYVHMPETALFYGGEQPLVLEYLVPFLLLGVFGLLWRWRTPGNLVLAWVLLTSMGNMLMTESAVFARYVVVFPALALLLALGVRYVLALLWPGRAALALMLALAAFMAVRQGVYYFDRHLNFYNWQLRPTYDSEDAMFRSADFPAGTRVHVISNSGYGAQYLSGVLGYLAKNPGLSVDVVLPDEFNAAYLADLPPEVDHAFYLEPYDVQAIGLLQQQYGDLLAPRFSPYNVPPERQLVLFYIPGTPGG